MMVISYTAVGTHVVCMMKKEHVVLYFIILSHTGALSAILKKNIVAEQLNKTL